MAQTITIHIWKEGEMFRSSVQEDTPGGYAFPEPFWSDYLEKKQVSRDLIAPFGEAIFRSAFNSLEREEMAHQILSGLKQAPLTFSIISSEDVIHEIPWELMKPPGGSFLGNMGNIAFARTLPGHKPVLRRSPQPYRVLVILSLPVETYEKAPLDPLREMENLYRALDDFVRKGTVKIDVCLRASMPEIRDMLVRTRYDVVHFIGHGGPGGLLVLEDGQDFTRSHETSPEDIAYLFGDLGVQAVILNACHTQSAGSFRPSLAMFIYRVGVPLVVANQGTVGDTEAAGTARALYEDLFHGESLPCLLNTARLKTGEWWKPVIFSPPGLSSKDLFLPAGEMTGALGGEKIFQDLGTLGTARVYVYRYRPLREISQHLAGDVKAIVLHGIGGAGKSFMADYLARFLRQEFTHVVALDLRRPKERTPQEIRTRILEIFESNEVISEKDAERLKSTRAFPLFWKRLNQAIDHVSWLLIIDNFESLQDEWGLVTDTDMLEMLRVLRGPEWSGRLVITSRLIPYTESRRSLEPVVEIGTYDDAEKQFLYLQLNKKEQEELWQHHDFVENDLGWHPLATDLLLKASGPSHTISGQSSLREVFSFYERYLERYPQAFARLFYMQHAFSPEFLNLLLKDADLLDLLARRLRLFRIQDGLWEPHPILSFIFAGNCSLSERDLRGLAEDLLPFEPKYLGDELNRLKVLEHALLLKNLPEEKEPELKEQIAYAASRSGDLLRQYGRVDDAVEHFNRALELRKALHGEKHPDVAGSYNNLGIAYHNKGDLDRAIAHYDKALELRKALHGEKHPDVAGSYNNLGMAYYNRGDLERAIEYHDKALELRKALYGEKHPDVATSYNNLGSAYKDKGDLERAIEYYDKALELVKALHGEKNPDVAGLYNNLGIAYKDKGDLDRAIEYHNKALELRKALYGEKYPDVAGSYNNLGIAYEHKGDLDRAIEYHNKALELRKALHGEKHPDVATSYNNLGSVYGHKGDLERAIEYLEKALELFKALYGEKYPDVATSYNNLGSAYEDKGDLERAIEYLEKALELFKALYGEKHPDVATSYNNLGLAYQHKGDLERAIEYHDKALGLSKALHGEKHPDVAISYNNLGSAYKDKGDLERAIEYLEKALELWKALYGEKHPYVATSYNNLGSAYENKGDLERAIEYHGDALRIWKGLPGYKKKELESSTRIAGLQAGTGRGTEAVRSLCEGTGLLEFLGSDPDREFWMSQALEILELAERLKTELEDDKLYNCRQIIQKYQKELGPVLEGLRMMSASSLENDTLSEDVRL